MAVYDLNALVKGMQSCLDRAQQRSDRRQNRLLQSLIEVGKDGEPKSLSWVCRLPSGDGKHRTHELVRLPWASLRSSDTRYTAKASIAFDCKVSLEHAPSTTQSPALTVIPVGQTKDKAKHTHRLKITLNGAGGIHDEISLDQHLIKTAGSREIFLPLEVIDDKPTKKRGLQTLFGWKSVAIVLVIGLLVAALWWLYGI